jgi:hypothetical protein
LLFDIKRQQLPGPVVVLVCLILIFNRINRIEHGKRYPGITAGKRSAFSEIAL